MREELTKHVLNVVSAMAYLNQEIESLFFYTRDSKQACGLPAGKKDR